MNNDLISREALIKALNEAQVEFDEYYKGLGKAKVITDNAPTVDIWQLRQEATENALKKAEVLYGRPQGEWKFNVKWQDYECPFCNEWVRPNIGGLPNFCPNCGALMRGKEE